MKEGDYVHLYLKSGISSKEYYVVPNVFEFFRIYIFFAAYYRRKSIFLGGYKKKTVRRKPVSLFQSAYLTVGRHG